MPGANRWLASDQAARVFGIHVPQLGWTEVHWSHAKLKRGPPRDIEGLIRVRWRRHANFGLQVWLPDLKAYQIQLAERALGGL